MSHSASVSVGRACVARNLSRFFVDLLPHWIDSANRHNVAVLDVMRCVTTC
jgi:hypothetical protein